MNSYEVSWEDDNCNRNIQFSINYTIENSEVKIADVTPTKVDFVCTETNEVSRTIGVHTAKGQNMLATRFRNSAKFEDAINAIAEKEGLLAAV